MCKADVADKESHGSSHLHQLRRGEKAPDCHTDVKVDAEVLSFKIQICIKPSGFLLKGN